MLKGLKYNRLNMSHKSLENENHNGQIYDHDFA
jgi:hypothetical protein